MCWSHQIYLHGFSSRFLIVVVIRYPTLLKGSLLASNGEKIDIIAEKWHFRAKIFKFQRPLTQKILLTQRNDLYRRVPIVEYYHSPLTRVHLIFFGRGVQDFQGVLGIVRYTLDVFEGLNKLHPIFDSGFLLKLKLISKYLFIETVACLSSNFIWPVNWEFRQIDILFLIDITPLIFCITIRQSTAYFRCYWLESGSSKKWLLR